MKNKKKTRGGVKKQQGKIISKHKKILKRDETLAPFRQGKITEAVYKAFKETGEGGIKEARAVSREVIKLLNKDFKEGYTPTVEEVQDYVEKVLMDLKFDQTAKAYILYRENRRKIRDTEASLEDAVDLINQYIGEEDWQVKENSNMAYSLQGLNNYISSIVSGKYWMDRVYNKKIKRAHEEGDLHIHDLDKISAYCCGWDLQDLLTRGFTGVPGKISCSPPKHFKTALGQVVNFFYTTQGEAAGAQAFSNFDTLLAPFIAYDKLDYKEVKQAMQEFVYNLNVPTRVGFQTPFTNLTMDLQIPKNYQEQNVIIGGEIKDKKYKEFQKEMNMLNKAFLEVMSEGDASGRVFTFPIPTYNIDKDFNWDDKELDLLWEMTAKYGIPYFANFVNSDMNPDDARSMCPLAGDEKVLIKSSRGRGVEYADIRQVYEGNSKQEEYEIYSDGKFVAGKFNKFQKQKMLKVVLENNHEIKMTERHLNFVLRNKNSQIEELSGKDLTTEMYLPYSLKEYKGDGGEPELGYFVGAYAGDGSFDGDTAVVFSLENHSKKELIVKLQKIAKKYFGVDGVVKKHKKTKLVTLRINSRGAVGLCRDFIEGKERNKHYKAKLFTMSLAFRKEVIAGHYATDGGNRTRIYTSSSKMVQSLNMLAATMGTTTSIYKDDRDDRFGSEPNYAVLIYQLNRKQYGDIWFKKYQKLWVKIKSIKPITNNTAYCFEVTSGEPMFTIGTTGVLTHNCRLRLDNRELHKRMGGLFGAAPLTGSIGVVTINLPRIGYLAEDKKDFFARLDEQMDIARDSLEIKRELVENLTRRGLYPYSKFYMDSIFQKRGSYWGNHFSTIGLIGMNEALLNFMGEKTSTKKGVKFAEEILEHMRDRMIQYQEETGNLYNLEATPGEGTSYRLAMKDKKRFPQIIFANNRAVRTEDAPPYYTNSSQLPVGFTEDIFEALDLQDKLQTKYTGGTVLHGFLGERINDPNVAKELVKRITTNYSLPYFTLTPTFSICPIHGYISGEHKTCPKCVAKTAKKAKLVVKK